MDGYLFIGYTLSRTVVPPDSPDKHPFFLVDQAEHPADLLTHPVRRNLEFVHPPVFLDQLDGYREQLDNIGCLGLHTVSNQPGVPVRIRVDIPVRKFLQVGMGQAAEAHENKHVPDGLLPPVAQLDADNALQILLREERTFLIFRLANELLELIYTTNLIENLNGKIRKYTKSKLSFPSDNAVKKTVYLSLMEIEKKWTQPIHNVSVSAILYSVLK